MQANFSRDAYSGPMKSLDFRAFQNPTDDKPPPLWKERKNLSLGPGQIPELYHEDLYLIIRLNLMQNKYFFGVIKRSRFIVYDGGIKFIECEDLF